MLVIVIPYMQMLVFLSYHRPPLAVGNYKLLAWLLSVVWSIHYYLYTMTSSQPGGSLVSDWPLRVFFDIDQWTTTNL